MALDEWLCHDFLNVLTARYRTEEAGVMARLKSGTHETRGHTTDTTAETLSLTARQQEVLRLVALGHTNHEISEQLGYQCPHG